MSCSLCSSQVISVVATYVYLSDEVGMHIKNEIRVLGIDDSSLEHDPVMIVGVVFRGGQWLDGVLRSEIRRDGLDATETIIKLVNNTRHFDQIRVVLLDGVTYAGFNVVDIQEVCNKTTKPVIVVMRHFPDFDGIKNALAHLPECEKRYHAIKRAGRITSVVTKDADKPIYIQVCGMDIADAGEIVKLTSTRSLIPEPLRVAHLIATGIVQGESRGSA